MYTPPAFRRRVLLIDGSNVSLHNMQIVHWPEIAAALEVTMVECQTFLHFFREQPGFYTTEPCFRAPHGTLINWESLRAVVHELHSEGGVMPVEIQLIWGYLEEIVDPSAVYVWFWNWNSKGPR